MSGSRARSDGSWRCWTTPSFPSSWRALRPAESPTAIASSPRRPSRWRRAGEYLRRLRRGTVIADVDARREEILRQIEAAAARHGFRPVVDEATLEAVVHLVESPMAVVGALTRPFWSCRVGRRNAHPAPPALLHHGDHRRKSGPTLRGHLQHARLDPTEIRRGNERVIGARLADADFYFREDLKVSPADRLPRWPPWSSRSGWGACSRRPSAWRRWPSTWAPPSEPCAPPVRAARLAKTDLASGMVREFPELQGITARRTRCGPARRRGGRAIREQYLPRGADDELPGRRRSVLAIADRIDTVVGCLGVGLVPTGSQDPYALRRQAQGIVQIPWLRISRSPWDRLVDRALDLLAGKLTESRQATRERSMEFLRVGWLR